MSIADIHNDWHAVRGFTEPCPWDCYDPFQNCCGDCGAHPDHPHEPTCSSTLYSWMVELALTTVPVTEQSPAQWEIDHLAIDPWSTNGFDNPPF